MNLRHDAVRRQLWMKIFHFTQNFVILVWTNFTVENRYKVQTTNGETLYYAVEISNANQRKWFGSNRAFTMRLFDVTQQLVLTFKRKLACGSCCLWCCLQLLEIYSYNGEYFGSVQQKSSCSKPVFNVKDRFNTTVYIIEGPVKLCCQPSYLNFQIYACDGYTHVGSIVHQWDGHQASYNTIVGFPNKRLDNKLKVLILGAGFLLEYLYFENMETSCCRCIC